MGSAQAAGAPASSVDLADGTVFEGNAATLHFESSDPGPLTYQWFQVSDQGVSTAIAAPAGGFTNTLTVTGVAATSRYQAAVTSESGTSATRVATLTFVPQSSITSWSSWQATPLASPNFIPAVVASGNGTLVALGGSAGWATSPTGETWTPSLPAPPAGVTMNSLVFGNGVFVAVGTFGRICSSPDGVTWTWHDVGAPTLTLRQVVFGDGRFVVLGGAQDGTAGSETLFTSADGVTWNRAALPSAVTFASAATTATYANVAAGNGRIVCAFYTSLATHTIASADGVNWTSSTSAVYAPSLAFGNGVFVRDDATSYDGQNWTARSSTYAAISFTAGMFVSHKNTDNATYPYPMPPVTSVWISADGVSWLNIGINITGASYGPVQGLNGGLLMFSSPNIYTQAPSIFYTGALPALQPAIGQQPVSALITPRQGVTLSTLASGGGNLTYQWYAGASGDVSHPIAGATGASLTPTPLVQTSSYWARATNAAGTADSQTATITVSSAFIAGGGSVNAGQPATFSYSDDWVHSVGAGPNNPTLYLPYTNVPVTYQWQHNNANLAGQTSSLLTLIDLGSGDSGTYRVLVTNAAGSLASDTVTLNVISPTPTVFTSQPVGGTADASGSYLLQAVATGAGTVTYQWYVGQPGDVTHPVTGATSSALQITSLTVTQSYWVRATSTAGTADSVAAAVMFVPPPVFQQQPAGGAIYITQSFTLTALATGQGTITYQWYKGLSGDVTHPVSGATGATFVPTPLSVTSSFWVRASGPVGSADSHMATVTVSTRLVPTFDPGGPWMRLRIVNATVTAPGATSFQATGLPPGLVLNKSSGVISGQPSAQGTFTLQITVRNNLTTSDTLIVPIVVAPLSPAVLGAFGGLIDRDVNANNSLGGKISLNFTSTGGFTGSMSLGSIASPLTGQVLESLADGSLRGSAGPTNYGRNPSPWLDFVVHADGSPLTGAVHLPASTGPGVAFTAVHNIWTGNIKPSAYAGTYTAAMLLPAGLAGDASYPQGTGYFGGTIDMNGGVAMSARLADNTVVTTFTILGPAQSLPLFFLLYGGTGSAQGWQTVSLDARLGAIMDGGLSWYKASQSSNSTTRSYKSGFPLHDLTTVGGKLVVPGTGQIELGLPNQVANALVTFAEGGLSTSDSESLRITTANLAQFAKGSPVAMTIDKTQGKFSGTYATGTGSAPFCGIFVPRLGLGFGQFQLPQSRAATSPILSGSVMLGGAR